MSKYSQDKPPKVGEVLDCGDPLAAQPKDSGGTGYAWTPDGQCICYEHADTVQRLHLARLDTPIVVYLASDDAEFVTSWTGGELAPVTEINYGSPRRTTDGNTWRMRYVTVVSLNGRVWRGQGSDQYNAVTLRRPRWMTKRGL